MGFLKACGSCCSVLSIWAILQLSVMALLYRLESVTLIQDAYADKFSSFEDFVKKTKENYKKVSLNCMIAVCIYIVALTLSCFCLRVAKRKAREEEKRLGDDEFICAPPQEIELQKLKNVNEITVDKARRMMTKDKDEREKSKKKS